MAAANPCGKSTRLQRLSTWSSEHVIEFNGCHPVAEGCREDVTGAEAVTFNKGGGPEVLDARSGRHQTLTTSSGSGVGMLWINSKLL